MVQQDAIKVVRESIEAFNAGDTKRFSNTLSSDAVYEEFATQRRVSGRDEIVKAVMGWRQAFPDAKGAISHIVASGNTVTMEITWEGTQRGPLVGAAGTIPATGKRVKVPAAQVVIVEGGKLKSTRHYFDMMTLMQQLGVAPGGGH